MEAAKKEELKLRKKIIAQCFTDDQVEGTQRIVLGKGWEIKAVLKMNYRFVGKQEEIVAALAKVPNEVATRLATWKATLSTKEFKLLSQEQNKIISDVIEIKPATPTLELVEPKE